MTEFATPDLSPEQNHGIIVERIKSAASELGWRPLGGLYFFERSAAAEFLTCCFPAGLQNEDDHRWTVSLDRPSLRFRKSLYQINPDARFSSPSNPVNFIIYNAQEALVTRNPGVDMAIIGEGLDKPVLEQQMTYQEFIDLAERGGIFDKASGSQLLGRRAIVFFDKWLKHLPNPGGVPPSDFSGW